MVERDLAQQKAKLSRTAEDMREYRNIRNEVNNMISREKFATKKSGILPRGRENTGGPLETDEGRDRSSQILIPTINY